LPHNIFLIVLTSASEMYPIFFDNIQNFLSETSSLMDIQNLIYFVSHIPKLISQFHQPPSS